MNPKPVFKSCFFIIFTLLLIFPSLFAGNNQEADKSAGPRVLSAMDTLRINQVSGPRLSPDGLWVVYTMSKRDMEDKDFKSTTHIWKAKGDGSNKRQMTRGKDNCTSPAWFPSGKAIAFLSSRGKVRAGDKDGEESSSQIFVLPIDGGEAWQLTEHKENIQSFRISPDGKKIAFTARDTLSEEEEKNKKEKDDAVVVDEKFRMSHLWVFDIDSKKAFRMTEGAFTVGDFRWSPDSKRITYVSRPNTKVDESWNSDIWVVDVEKRKPKLLFENPGPDSNPRWSPDGKTIAFASHPQTSTSTWYSKLHLIPAGGGGARVLLEKFDLNFSNPIWSPDGKTIFWSAGDRTTTNLFSVDVQSGKVKRLVPPRGRNSSWELAKDGMQWVWVHAPATWPSEIYAADIELKNLAVLTDANPWLREEGFKFGKVETVRWKNSDGQEIEGVLTYPVDYKFGKEYPLILNPHGGPSGVRIETFSTSNQFFAGNGFFIFQPNFRGSVNYGQEFVNANRGKWGIVDYEDCMTGVDYCIEKGWADPDRLICYGWSYGGYMSFWIVTQTNRFKAVSPGAGLPNLYSMYSTTDIPRYLAWFFGTPWDNEETFEKLSAIRHVKNVKSPVLILHGEKDARVPISQSVEFYQALRDLGKDVTFVKYPREGHGLREPRHQLDRLRRYLYFFAKHVDLTPISEIEWEKEQAKKKEDKKEKK
ncbi:MAG: S9 family peptidase [Candidatus Aminicenantes bacterium]|nr:MAG: S9 family peptidase [Candidatus Aminicenantes bacterium]